MTKDETIAILKVIKISYPHFYKDMKKEDALDLIDIWSMMFSDEQALVVTEAVKALICSLKYPPTIADVKEKINTITKTNDMTEFEAWNIVYRAICNSAYNAKEHFEAMPDIIKRIVGSPNQLREWSQMDSETVSSVVQSNFMRSYKSKSAQAKEYQMLPQSTKTLMLGIQEKLKMIGGE